MSLSHPFRDRLKQGPILCDGAMGTRLYTRGVSHERCFEELNLADPEMIKSVHLDYIAAGAEIVETNTFGANRIKLTAHGLGDKVRQINRAGAKIAREARDLSGQAVFLAGSLGPLGQPLGLVDSAAFAAAEAAYREQAEALLEAGIDLFIVETISDAAEMRAALRAIRPLGDLPIVAQMSFGEDGTTQSGEDPATAARMMRDLGADVVGVNCALGPADTLAIVEAMRGDDGMVFSAQPNAGLPQRVENRFIYMSTPEYFATYARRFLEAGAVLVGGCCGTTPEHIAAMSAVVRGFVPAESAPSAPVEPPVRIEVAREPEALERAAAPQRPTHLAELFDAGRFAISVEMSPPRSVKFAKFLQNAAYLRDIGVDTINIPDNAMARVRMSNIAAAHLVQEFTGVETIIHFTPRDRNLMAIQSDLVGAHATGIRNVLAVTGDPPSHGDFPDATGNWDVDSIGLIAILANLNAGLDSKGRKLGAPASFAIGCAATPTAPDLVLDLERLHRKIATGAQFIMTQPVHDPAQFHAYFARYEELYGPVPIPIMVGLQPLHSYQQAEKFHHEVPGIDVPEAVRERLRRAGEHGMAVGLEITYELIDAVLPSVRGAYIMPLDRYDLAGQVLQYLRGKLPTETEGSVASHAPLATAP